MSLNGLNPCCNGRGSKTSDVDHISFSRSVLILVVMEEGQRQLPTSHSSYINSVLILVVMEEGQRLSRAQFSTILHGS